MESSSSVPGTAAGGKPATAFSCVRCFERKVKCDRQQPCAACTKHKAECIYRVPPPPRRRKRRLQEDILTERLRRYEQVLQQQGIDPSEIAPQADLSSKADRRGSQDAASLSGESAVPDRKYASSQLIYDSGRAHYVENNLWNRVTEEFGTPHDAFDASSGSEDEAESQADGNTDFVLAWTPSSAPRPYHPPPEHVFSLWQIFLENVNPLSKVVHHPTLQILIQRAATNLDKVPRGLEALMFAVYSAAIFSLKDQECDYHFGEKKKTLLSRYRHATKVALSRAKFLGTSDLVVLQALVLHLLTTRDEYDPRTLWILTGVAVRIGEGMGLHKDGSTLGLPFFESEIRRRIYWQLAMLDFRSAELSGAAKFRPLFHEDFRVGVPLNLDDEQFGPGMRDPPLPQIGATEMVFCLLRYHFGKFWSQKQEERARKGGQDHHLWSNYESVGAIAEMDKEIDELQQMIQTVYVRYCDPTEPVQLMASLVASVAIASMRLVAHHPRRYSREEDIPDNEKQLLWITSLKLLEGDNMAYTDRKLSRFVWHTAFYFQWQAIIHVLDCLRAQPLMPEANKAWQLIDEVYENHPEFIADTKKPIHVAVGTLCLKAFNAREHALSQQGASMPLKLPGYIYKLRQQREAAHAKQTEAVVNKLQAQQLSGSVSPQVEMKSPSMHHQPHPRQQHSQQSSFSPFGSTTMSPASSDPMTLSSFDTSSSMFQQQQHHHHRHQPQPQVSGAFISDPSATLPPNTNPWFDNFGYQNPVNQTADVDFMLAQDGNAMDSNANMIDWTQWDTLLQDFGDRS